MSDERDDLDYRHDALPADEADGERKAADNPESGSGGEPDTETEAEADTPSSYGSP